eukprot:4460154-Pleurochrysis_carterae.AAC.2
MLSLFHHSFPTWGLPRGATYAGPSGAADGYMCVANTANDRDLAVLASATFARCRCRDTSNGFSCWRPSLPRQPAGVNSSTVSVHLSEEAVSHCPLVSGRPCARQVAAPKCDQALCRLFHRCRAGAGPSRGLLGELRSALPSTRLRPPFIPSEPSQSTHAHLHSHHSSTH